MEPRNGQRDNIFLPAVAGFVSHPQNHRIPSEVQSLVTLHNPHSALPVPPLAVWDIHAAVPRSRGELNGVAFAFEQFSHQLLVLVGLEGAPFLKARPPAPPSPEKFGG